MQTFNTFQELRDYINQVIVTNANNDITGEEHNNVENGLLTFIQKSILNNDRATIVTVGGAVSLPAPFTVISGTVPISISWADNIYNEYFIVNATGSSIPLAAGFTFYDTYNTQQTIIPARAIVHIIKAKNNNWFQANTIVGASSDGLPPQTGHDGESLFTNGTSAFWAPTGSASAPTISTKTSNYAILTTDDTILVNTAAGAVSITYNPALDTKIRRIKNIGSSGNSVTVTPSSGTIDGNSSNIIGDLEVRTIQSNLTNLYLL